MNIPAYCSIDQIKPVIHGESCLGVEVVALCPHTAEDLQPPLASDDLAPGPALGGAGFVPWFDEGFAPAGRPVRHRFVQTDGA